MRASFRQRKDALVLKLRSRFPVLASRILLLAPRVRRAIRRQVAGSSLAAAFRLSNLAGYLRKQWLLVVLLAAIGFLVHLPALQGQRIWDDDYLSRDNPFIKSPLLILEAFRHYLFLDSFSAHYRPIQNISFIIDYFFWNTDELGFHLTNVLLHIGSGVLLYFLLRQLFASLFLRRISPAICDRVQARIPWISHGAFLVALLWIVHPVHSAAVDYISGRADSLAFLFASAGWLLFRRAQQTPQTIVRSLFYLLAAISGLLALLSREIACIWIALFLGHLLFVEKRKYISIRARLSVLACCLMLIVAYAALRQLPVRSEVRGAESGWSAPVRAALMVRALGDYGRLMIIPSNLHMERTVVDPATYRSNAEWRETVGIEYLSILGLSVFAGLIWGCAKRGPGQALRIFGASWFLTAYLPISNIVQLNATVAEHWLYLPSVGFLIFVAGCALELPRRHWNVAVIIALVAVAGLSARSYVRSTDWLTAEEFYRRTIMAGGTSARISVNLGQAYSARGADAEAEKLFRRILQLVPGYPLAQNNLANILCRQGKIKEAETLFALVSNDSVKPSNEYPRTWIASINLAELKHKANDDKTALGILEKSRTAHPDVWEIVSYESELLRQTQGPAAGLGLVEKFARKYWWHYRAAVALGRLYAAKGDVDLADAALRHASWLDVHDAEALNLIATMRMRQNRFEDACRIQRRAVARQPDEPRQYILLSNILEKMGRGDEARAALAQVSRLRALAGSQPVAN
jgi:Flp pilus assembly protein TadD